MKRSNAIAATLSVASANSSTSPFNTRVGSDDPADDFTTSLRQATKCSSTSLGWVGSTVSAPSGRWVNRLFSAPKWRSDRQTNLIALTGSRAWR